MHLKTDHIIETILTSLSEDERAHINLARLSAYIHSQVTSGETDRDVLLVKGMRFAREQCIGPDISSV